jgi:hypothetical protein
MEALQRVRLEGYEMVICELEVEQDYLRRATRYLEDETPPPPPARAAPRTPRR